MLLFLSVFQVAKIMKLPVRHVRYLIDMTYLEGYKIRNTLRVPKEAIKKYYEEFGNSNKKHSCYFVGKRRC